MDCHKLKCEKELRFDQDICRQTNRPLLWPVRRGMTKWVKRSMTDVLQSCRGASTERASSRVGERLVGKHCLDVESTAVDNMVQLSASPCLRVDGV